jgi:CRP-like cAMP-binding protein
LNDFFTIVNDIVPLQKEERMALARNIHIRHLGKGEVWIKEGMIAFQIAFISEGYLRKYRRHEGREVTEGFYFDNSFAADFPSVLSSSPARYNLVAMTPTELFLLSYGTLSGLAQKYPSVEHFLRVLIEQDFIAFHYQHTILPSIPPPDRYLQLVRDRPQIARRAEPYHIASFLGMTQGQLSRVAGTKRPGSPRV